MTPLTVLANCGFSARCSPSLPAVSSAVDCNLAIYICCLLPAATAEGCWQLLPAFTLGFLPVYCRILAVCCVGRASRVQCFQRLILAAAYGSMPPLQTAASCCCWFPLLVYFARSWCWLLMSAVTEVFATTVHHPPMHRGCDRMNERPAQVHSDIYTIIHVGITSVIQRPATLSDQLRTTYLSPALM